MTKARDIADFKFENITDTGTEGTRIALGTTAQRGSTQGQLRFNSTTGLAEYYDGASFKAIDSPPDITSISPTSIDEDALGANQTIVITGTNFSTGVIVKIIGNDTTEITPASTTRDSATQITITTPTSGITASNEPYSLKITNSSGLAKTGSNLLSINDSPVFTVASGSLGTLLDSDRAASNLTAVTANDEEGDTITFAITTGSAPSGLTFNSNGTWSGTANAVSTTTQSNFTVTATSGSQAVTRDYTITVNEPIVYQALVVGGGGSGGYTTIGWAGGGGGSGGIAYHNNLPMSDSTNYTVTVGQGGSEATGHSEGGTNLSDSGQNSQISGSAITTLIGYGGGGGAGYHNAYTIGASGGSGGGSEGGGSYSTTGASATQGTGGTSHYGSNGGSGSRGDPYNAGGGGGTGETGSTDGIGYGGDGTADFDTWLAATSTGVASGGTRYIAGGGSGGRSNGAQVDGGLGGGGQGGNASGGSGTAGTANTGSGGGGRGRYNMGSGTGGAGGSGLVIIRYNGAQQAGSSGGAIVTSGGYTYHTFTSSGTFRTNT